MTATVTPTTTGKVPEHAHHKMNMCFDERALRAGSRSTASNDAEQSPNDLWPENLTAVLMKGTA